MATYHVEMEIESGLTATAVRDMLQDEYPHDEVLSVERADE